jgi:hypothetical protein
LSLGGISKQVDVRQALGVLIWQVDEVRVCGPRYWQQRLLAEEVGSSGGPLGGLYRTGTLYVQRKSGALAYPQDPSGMRSLMSEAFDEVHCPDLHATWSFSGSGTVPVGQY